MPGDWPEVKWSDQLPMPAASRAFIASASASMACIGSHHDGELLDRAVVVELEEVATLMLFVARLPASNTSAWSRAPSSADARAVAGSRPSRTPQDLAQGLAALSIGVDDRAAKDGHLRA